MIKAVLMDLSLSSGNLSKKSETIEASKTKYTRLDQVKFVGDSL